MISPNSNINLKPVINLGRPGAAGRDCRTRPAF